MKSGLAQVISATRKVANLATCPSYRNVLHLRYFLNVQTLCIFFNFGKILDFLKHGKSMTFIFQVQTVSATRRKQVKCRYVPILKKRFEVQNFHKGSAIRRINPSCSVILQKIPLLRERRKLPTSPHRGKFIRNLC